MHHGRAAELVEDPGRCDPVCGELLILGKSVIRHTQARLCQLISRYC